MTVNPTSAQCPLPIGQYDRIVLGHGSGGKLSADLIGKLFVPGFDNDTLSRLEDSAVLEVNGSRLAFTTDSYVVRPIFFPGGDIGSLAVHGTVNDLAVAGATPLFLSAGFILEEGFPIEELHRVVQSMNAACRAAGVALVTGDTKVVDRGKGDKIFINTSGIGLLRDGISLSIRNGKPGDRVLVSGTVGDHGIAILSVREGLEFETELKSDSAPLHDLVKTMLETAPSIRCMRDATRGGVASVLNELADASNAGVRIDESAVPVGPEVRGACELLGLDPLYVANEGKLVAVVPPSDADRLLSAMRSHPLGANAAVIGEITSTDPGTVSLQSVTGGHRRLPMLAGEQLPRIC